jgi:uncharacterized protein (DUF1778 family)
VKRTARSAQLQIRVSAAQKSAIQRAATRAGLDMSSYVLSCAVPRQDRRFERAVADLSRNDEPAFALAALNRLLTELSAGELEAAVAAAPRAALTPHLANYLAAMVEQACARRSIPPPGWTRAVAPPSEPYFGSTLHSLRLHLLLNSPPPFRQRNIFIDSSIGAQV